MKPLVSIIMPAYNAEATVGQAIESILNQTYSNIELLVADDGSTDNTKNIIDRFTDVRIKRFHNKKNLAYLQSINKLFSVSKGCLIAFQDADDYSCPDRIEKQVKAFEDDQELGICGTFGEYYDYKTGAFLRAKKPATEHNAILKGMYQQFQFCGTTMMIRREVLNDIGYYREYFDRLSCAHYDWAFLIVEKYKARNIPEPLYKYYTTPNSITRSIKDKRKLFTDKIVRFLAEERKEKGKDSLMVNDRTALDQFVALLEQPYVKDGSLMYRDTAIKNYYSKMYENVFRNCWMAIKTEPLRLVNYRLLFYYIRKIVFVKSENRHLKAANLNNK
jgi:glycosyltransferase involved in cell wall biosynthesis